MSRQYSNHPFVSPRRRVSLQMCEFVPYPTSQTNDAPPDNSSWQLSNSLAYIHQQPIPTPALPPPPPPPPVPSLPTQNDFSYFQYPPHRHTMESPLLAPNLETNNNQHVHHLNEPHPSCHFRYLDTNEEEPPRPLLPLSLVTVKKKHFFLFII
jgi:hypothetical protein